MFMIADICIILAFVCAAWALVPDEDEPTSKLPKLAKAQHSLVPGLAGQRRGPLPHVFRLLGSFVPHGPWSQEFRASAIYPTSSVSIEEFRGIKLLCALIMCGVTFVLAVEFRRLASVLAFMVAFAIGFFMPDLWLRSKLQKRDRRIVRLLPEVIDLLALCVGAGVDFLGALNRVIAVKAYQREPLIEELSVAIQEMKFGKRKVEALKGMSRRVNIPEVTSFVRAIAQADRMGTPIADVLAVHAEDVRIQRFNRAERAALKAPIKIIFPLIFCIMPCVGILVGAPVFIEFIKQNPFSNMTGQ